MIFKNALQFDKEMTISCPKTLRNTIKLCSYQTLGLLLALNYCRSEVSEELKLGQPQRQNFYPLLILKNGPCIKKGTLLFLLAKTEAKRNFKYTVGCKLSTMGVTQNAIPRSRSEFFQGSQCTPQPRKRRVKNAKDLYIKI